MAESFVDSFKTELIADRVWRTRAQLELAIVEYISWFNHDRLHESRRRHPARRARTASRPGSRRHPGTLALLSRPARLNPTAGTTPPGSSPRYGVKTRLADNN